MTVVHMIGNAHIDPVWLWGWQAGVDEALATLSAAADRCEEFPDFVFTRGEAWVYRQAEQMRPDLFKRIARLVKAGQWHITGGTWLQPDLNLPTEVALRRQFRHGQRYFQDRFGIRPRIGYNVDSFGHPAFLPDLLAEHGYAGYVFGRPDPAQKAIPFSAFRWRGAGGAELPAFRIYPGYAQSLPDLRGHLDLALSHSDPALGHTMCFYGVGDHGGGPTRRQIEWIRAHRTALPGIELRFSTPAAFFAAIADRHADLPLVEGELQNCFPGCYSAMGAIKRQQRHGEHLLDQADRAAAAFSADAAERSSHEAAIDAAWEDLLFTAFHDIVTGTATPSAWQSCRAMQGRARIVAEEVLLRVTRGWSQRALPPTGSHRIVVVNTDDTPFDGLIEHETWLDYDLWQDRFLADANGVSVPLQHTQPDAMHRVPRLLFPARIPPNAATVLEIRPGPAPEPPTPAPKTDLSVSPSHIANAWLRVDLGPAGITGLAWRGRPLLAAGGITLHLRQDHTDTWSTGADRFAGPIVAVLANGAWTVEETGPLRARVRMENRLGTSRLRWTLSLDHDDPRLRMHLEINFDERFAALQLAAHPAIGAIRRTDEIPGGAIDRPFSPAECPVQGWSRIAFADAALAVLTQDAFSVSAEPGLWQWTLLRSPLMAWQGGEPPVYHGRDTHTDQGEHDFALDMHVGDTLSDTALDIAARRMAQRLITFERTDGAERPF